MNLKTNSVLAALALAITTSAQAGPGPRDPVRIQPRSISTEEVTLTCPRCQQVVHAAAPRAAKPARKYIATATRPGVQKVM